MAREVFISHAVKDKGIADALVTLLFYLNLRTENIFCSSLEGMKIPTGDNFIKFVHDQITDPKIVILLLSPHYFESTFCVAELGGCWATKQNIFPIVIPPLDFPDLKAVLTAIQARQCEDKQTYNELKDRCADVMSFGKISSAQWDQKVDSFLKHLKPLIEATGAPTKVSFKAHQELLEQYEDAKEQMTKKDQQIEEIAKLKDKVEVAKAVAAVDDDVMNQFEQLAEAAKHAINRVTNSNVFREILFAEFGGGSYVPDQYDDMKPLLDYKYVEENDGAFCTNRGHPKVAAATSALGELDNFLRIPPDGFVDAFVDRRAYPPEIDNKDLWHDYLGLK